MKNIYCQRCHKTKDPKCFYNKGKKRLRDTKINGERKWFKGVFQAGNHICINCAESELGEMIGKQAPEYIPILERLDRMSIGDIRSELGVTKAKIKYVMEVKKRNYDYVTRYSMTLVEYLELVELQEECCAECGRHLSKLLTEKDEEGRTRMGNHKRLLVDHHNELGFFRGLICNSCNYERSLLD